ncbi:MAG: hypothetical protein ACR2OJ_03545 [Hyphomicrobiales bacterium]
MRRLIFIGVLAGLSLLTGACAQKSSPEPIATNIQRTETVRYNKRDYIVSFKYDQGSALYNVNVKRPSRPMSSNAKDKDNAVQVASSTVSYYSCPKGYRGRLVPGTASYRSNKSWQLAARCKQSG